MKLSLTASLIAFLTINLTHGQIYVASQNTTVDKYTLAGDPDQVPFVIPVPGLGLPNAVALDSHGNVFVLLDGGVVAEYDPTGALIQMIELGFFHPYGIALDQSDQIYVSDMWGDRVVQYSASGKPLNLSFITGLSGPTGLAFDNYGHLFVANWRIGTIAEYNLDGTLVNPTLISGVKSPMTISYDGHLRLYVVNNYDGTVEAYAVTGATISRPLISGLSLPAGIATAGTNTLLVADWGKGLLAKYLSDGRVIDASFITGLNTPVGVAVNMKEPRVTPRLEVPASVIKGSGILTNAGKLALSSTISSNTVFSLNSSDPTCLAVPEFITVLAGSSNAAFDVVVGGNQVADGDRSVRLTTSAPTFADADAVVAVFDDKPSRTVELSPIASAVIRSNCPVQALHYDAIRDRLVAALGTAGANAPVNGLALINPHTGLTESFESLSETPGALAATDNGEYLYVSLPQIGVLRRLRLSDFSTELEFFAGPSLTPDKLAAVPGHPDWLVSTFKDLFSGAASGMGVYTSGVLGAQTLPGGPWAIEFDTDAGLLFAANAESLNRCSVDSTGVSVIKQFPPVPAGSADIKYASGELFTSNGRVIQAETTALSWLFSGAENASLVVPDAASGRVFYLSKNDGWQIKAFDIASHRPLGNISLPDLAGDPGSLIRWGSDGLAFCTSSNQLFVIRSALVQTNTGADLSLSLKGPTIPVAISNTALVSLTISNSGPGQATGIQITNTYSPSVSLQSVSGAVGTWTTNDSVLVWSVPVLAAGSQSTLSITIIGAQAGLVTAKAWAVSGTLDLFPGDNTVQEALVIGAPPVLNEVGILQLPANDVQWSSTVEKLLLTSSTKTPNWGGALLTVDPYTLAVQFQTTMGSDAQHIALAEDGSALSVGVDSGVAMLSLPDFKPTRAFTLTADGPPSYACALRMLPGAIENLIVAAKSRSSSAIHVEAYDAGVRRTNSEVFFADSMSLEFAEDPNAFYGKATGLAGLRSYSLDPAGVQLVSNDNTVLPMRTAVDLLWAGGRMFTSAGSVIHPTERRVLGIVPGIPSNAQVLYDERSKRVFYLCSTGAVASLKAFDSATLLPIGTQVVAGLQGSPSRFVRWGLDGFAILTADGQLALCRSSLVATNPPADVSVEISTGIAPFVAGSSLTGSLLITNQGPNEATDLAWTNALPPGAVVLNAATSLGSISSTTNIVFGTIPKLGVGSAATMTVTYLLPGPGITICTATVSASSIDLAYSNNIAVVPMWVRPNSGLSPLTGLTLPVKDLERDPIRPILYASFGPAAGALANTVMPIDPIKGTIGPAVGVGPNPGRMAASADGQYLYVALDDGGMVQKLSLPGLATVGSFAVPGNQIVSQISVCPTNSEVVALRRTPANAIGVFVGGTELPREVTTQNLFAFSPSSGQLYACDGAHSNVKLYRLNTGSDGLSLGDSQPGKQSSANDLKGAGNLLFFDRGMVLNADIGQVASIMPVALNSVVEPDIVSGRVFYLTTSASAWTLRAFDIRQGIEIGALPMPSLLSPPVRLLRWGQSGLAFYTTNSQVFILNGILVPTNPPVDVVLSQTAIPGPISTNDTLNITLELTNCGPITASGVIVTQSFSISASDILLTPSLGTASYTNGVTTWYVGSLPTNTPASLYVSMKPSRAGSMTIAASAYHDLNDAFWGNNVAMDVVAVTNSSQPYSTLILQLPVREMVYDTTRDRLYASTPASNRLAGNLIAVIDPASGRLISALPAGSEPDQLALSDDDRYLYRALNGAFGVQRVDLQSSLEDLWFPLGTNDIYSALDLAIPPHRPDILAASLQSYNFAAGYPSSVYLYDHGVARRSSGGPSRGLTFSDDGSVLFGYSSPGSGNALVRMFATGDGFTTDGYSVFSSMPGNLRYANGRVYSSSGQVVDPFAPALIGTFTATSGSHAIDAAAGRAYYLAQRSPNWEIRAFDLGSLQSVDTQTVSSVFGTPRNLIRCGPNRLAFCTSSNQVFILQSSVASTNILQPAAVSITQRAFQDFAAATETLRFIITITNAGPATASNVLLAIRPPTPAASIDLVLPAQASSNAAGGSYICNLRDLPAAQSLTVTLDLGITNTAIFTNFASVSASTPDPEPRDNTSLVSAQGSYFQRPDTVQSFNVASTALAYDAVGQRLFAAIASKDVTNAVAWFDPRTGLRLGSIQVDIPATAVLITDDSHFLYLISSSTNLIERVDLQSMSIDLYFTPPEDGRVLTAAIIPQQPHALAIVYATRDTAYTIVVDDGIPREEKVEHYYRLLAAAPDTSALYGYDNTSTGGASPDVFRMSLSASGVKPIDNGPSDTPWGANVQMRYSQGVLFFANGNVLSPSTWTEQPAFGLPFWGSGFDLVPAANIAAFLYGDYNSSYHFGIYSINGRGLLKQFDLGYTMAVDNPVWCGADRFAFRSATQLYFLRSSALPTADLAVEAAFSTNQAMAGDPIRLDVIVTNRGPAVVSGVSLSNQIPAGLRILSAALSKGALATNGQTIVGGIDRLESNESAVLTVTLTASGEIPGWVTSTADVQATGLLDPVVTNNHAAPNVYLLPFAITGFSLAFDQARGTNVLMLSVGAALGSSCTLEASTDLKHWAEVPVVPGPPGSPKVEVPFDSTALATFYRLRFGTN